MANCDSSQRNPSMSFKSEDWKTLVIRADIPNEFIDEYVSALCSKSTDINDFKWLNEDHLVKIGIPNYVHAGRIMYEGKRMYANMQAEDHSEKEADALNNVDKTVIETLKSVLKTQEEMRDTLKELTDRLEKSQYRYLELTALVYVREVIDLMMKVLNRYHDLKPFSRLLSKTMDGKECPERVIQQKFDKFKEDKKKVKLIEEKVKDVRNEMSSGRLYIEDFAPVI